MARAMFTTSAIFTWDTAPADAFRRCAVEPRGMTRLADHPVRAGRIDRPEDRAEVLRVLDPVEHHDQRRSLCRDHQVLDAEGRGLLHLGDHALVAMTRAPCQAIELVGSHATHGTSWASARRTTAVRRSSARGDTWIAVARLARNASSTD
jgi:hypothetical protein